MLYCSSIFGTGVTVTTIHKYEEELVNSIEVDTNCQNTSTIKNLSNFQYSKLKTLTI